MSYLPPEETGYFEAIQVYFTALTDKLALFGARDRALLERWKEEGRPARLVCRGLQQAVAAFEDGPPRSLAQCERFVDEQWESHRQRSVGRHEDCDGEDSGRKKKEKRKEESSSGTLYDQVRQAIEEAGRAADEERWRQAYRRAWRTLKEVGEEAESFGYAEVDTVDRALVDAYLDALRDEERRVVEEAVASVGAGLLQGMSSTARREHLRIKKKQALLESFELLDLIGAIEGGKVC